MSLTLAPFSLDGDRFNPALGSQRKPARVSFITDHDNNLGVWDFSVTNRVVKRKHVRPTTGDEDRDSLQMITSRLPAITVPIS